MNNMIAYCRLVCDSCPIYLATLEQNKSRQEAMRISIAGLCSEHYGMNLQADDITDFSVPVYFEDRAASKLYNQAKMAPPIKPSTNPHAKPMRLPRGLIL